MQDMAEEHRKGTGENRGEQGNTGYGRLVRSTGEGQESTGRSRGQTGDSDSGTYMGGQRTGASPRSFVWWGRIHRHPNPPTPKI